MSGDTKILVIPCSGIGKAYGSVAREAGYELCDEVRPAQTQLVALSKLVLGEVEAQERVRRCPAITIDGCKLRCAAALVELNGGTIAREVSVIDAFKRHRHLKPEGVAELNDAGKQLARVMAEEMAAVVDEHGEAGREHA